MLNEEDKKAIEYLTKYIHWETAGERSLETDIGTVLNLITKLQKENELAKEQLKKQCEIADERNDLLVKIQELQKQINLMSEVMFKSNKAQLLIEYGIENKEQIIKEFEKLVKEKGE